ncbi:uncharacterized protein LOC111048637 isoform X2 [Nilaparvata lugens]|uniref:uncharacterized protein LOC111048637 isoform X2 n=1 Tax=Nilaparvata lugens TaxID=108931 RepID=UPI00193DFEDB|nr:uncharacterized protein LOC111048637 isoform X2 [Nilaparvata lugens]
MADNASNAATVHEPSQKIPGQRPGSWVYYNGGYCYHINKTTNDKRYLVCAQSRCWAKAWMRLEENAPIFQLGIFVHAHLPDYEKAPKMQFLHNVKKRSREEADRSVKSILLDESLKGLRIQIRSH